MQSDNTVSLKVNGKLYKGWLSVEIISSLLSLARTFAVSATRSRNTSGDLTDGIRAGDSVEIFIGEDKVLTGYVMKKTISYSSSSINIEISGASKTIDLEQCTMPDGYPLSYKNQTHLQNLQCVCKPYGIEVSDEVRNTKKCDFEIKPTEKIKDAVFSYLKKHMLSVGDDEDGKLVIREPCSSGQASDSLILGKNVLTGKRTTDHNALYSEYVEVGQATNPTSELPITANQLKATQKNKGISRVRILCNAMSGNATQQELIKQAVTRCAISSGEAETFAYEVHGWRQNDSKVWRINQVISVYDSCLGFTGELLIVSVRLSKNERGERTQMTLQPPSAFKVLQTKDDSKTKAVTFDDVLANSGKIKDTKWTN